MFTGIVEEVGEIRGVIGKNDITLFTVSCVKALQGISLGDSISVSGVCLTVVDFNRREFTVEATPETMNLTTLEHLGPGSKVNLERALRLGGKLGGHLVSGHIDGRGEISEINRQGRSYVLTFQAPSALMRYIVPKGSVAVDGISLTVTDAEGGLFSVAVIPFTYKDTTISLKRIGSPVNIECDIIGKYVERLLSGYAGRGSTAEQQTKGLDQEFLSRHGFV
jgi:riboflavin synthase